MKSNTAARGLGRRRERDTVEELALERGEEALAERIIVAVADGPHRRADPGLATPRPEGERRVLGEFNWSSQHLDDEVLRCRNGDGEGQTGRVDLRCVRPVARG